MSGYSQPTIDSSSDIYNTTGSYRNGVVTLEFTRKRNTGDRGQDLRLDECLYIMYPVKGGTYNSLVKRIGKHESTPVVSNERICMKPCFQSTGVVTDSDAAKSVPEPKSEPEPKHEPKPKYEPEAKSEPEPKPEPEPKLEPGNHFSQKPKPEPNPETKPKAEPEPKVTKNGDCLGEFRHPSNCEGEACEYTSQWGYNDNTDMIDFTVTTRSKKWTGIGFSKNKLMSETDAILGWVEETGRFFIMDVWMDSYEAPLLDPSQDIANISGARVNGITTLKFSRKRTSGDHTHDLQFTDSQCLYAMFPTQGGVFNAVSKKIRKHDVTPIVSSNPICIRTCSKFLLVSVTLLCIQTHDMQCNQINSIITC